MNFPSITIEATGICMWIATLLTADGRTVIGSAGGSPQIALDNLMLQLICNC